MSSQFIIQLSLVVIAVVVGVTFIRPTLADISVVQGEIMDLEQSLQTAKEANAILSEKTAQVERFSDADRERLNRFLPASVNPIAVMRDIEIVANDNRVSVETLEADFSSTVASSESSNRPGNVGEQSGEALRSDMVDLETTTISVSVLGSYQNTKAFLAALERNVYPLEPVGLDMAPADDSSLITTSLELEVYALPAPAGDDDEE